MDSNIFTFTEKRFNAASNEGIATRETRELYNQFADQKQAYLDAKDRYREAETRLTSGGRSVNLELVQAHRALRAAETQLTHLSQAIAQAILKIRREGGYIRRIDYRGQRA